MAVAIHEQAKAGRIVGRAMLPTRTSAVNRAPPRGTLYTAPNPAPAPHATRRRRCAGDRPTHPANTLAEAPPMSLGAASRPSEAPMPMTTSEITDVPRLRRNDSFPLPFHTASSTSEHSPLVYRRNTYQVTPPTAPAMSRTTTRRSPDTFSTADSKLPV